MKSTFNMMILLVVATSIGSPCFLGCAHAENKSQTACEQRNKETVVQAGPESCLIPNADRDVLNEADLRMVQLAAKKPANVRADSWNGRFKFSPGQNEHGHYEQVGDVACDTDSNCTSQKSLQIEGKEIPEPPIFDGSKPTLIPSRLPFNIDNMTTIRFRRSVLDLASVSDFPHAAPYFEPEIYRRIGTPNHVVECRANILVTICKLDEPLVPGDYGSLTAWVIPFPDMSSGPGYPGYGCPHALMREDQK